MAAASLTACVGAGYARSVRRGLVIVTCTLALAACGSGSKGPSRVEYAQRADAICSRYNQQTARLGGRGTGVENLARIADRTLVSLDRATARLRALPIPKAGAVLAK